MLWGSRCGGRKIEKEKGEGDERRHVGVRNGCFHPG